MKPSMPSVDAAQEGFRVARAHQEINRERQSWSRCLVTLAIEELADEVLFLSRVDEPPSGVRQ